MGWSTPEQLHGDPHYIRVFAGATKEEDGQCPLHRAIKARPGLRPRARRVFFAAPLELFALGPVMTELDRRESIQRPSRRRRQAVHPGLACWVEQAIQGYLHACHRLDPQQHLRPVADRWVLHREADGPDGKEVYDLCAWGRQYESVDGRLRELRLLRFGSRDAHASGSHSLSEGNSDDHDGSGADGRTRRDQREPGVVELAAYVVAMGGPAIDTGYATAYQPLPQQQLVERVRIVEVWCTDGEHNVLFDGTPANTVEPYRREAAGRLRATVDATERIPGVSCAKCPLALSCSALKKAPGVLGVDQPRVPRRKVSMSDLRNHKRCPAQMHLRELNLPRNREIEYGPAERRGQAVHEYIKTLHARPDNRPCTADDAPRQPQWSAGKWHVSGEEAQLANELIRRHVAVCPLRYADPGVTSRSEPLVTTYDPDAEAIIVATPDLLYTDEGSIIWREMKTTRFLSSRTREDLLDTYPQAALAIVLMARGVLAADTTRSRVELEILRPTGPDLEIISPNQPERLAKAQQVVAGLARAWHGDARLLATPGKDCRRCEVAQWCPDRLREPVEAVGQNVTGNAS